MSAEEMSHFLLKVKKSFLGKCIYSQYFKSSLTFCILYYNHKMQKKCNTFFSKSHSCSQSQFCEKFILMCVIKKGCLVTSL